MSKSIFSKDLNWGLLAQGFSAASAVLLLPFVLVYLDKQFLGLWFVFSTLAGLGYLLELGFQPTIARNVSYIYAGATELHKEGVSLTSSSGIEVDKEILISLYQAAKKIYMVIGVSALCIMVIPGAFYIKTLLDSTHDVREVLMAWFFFSSGFLLSFYYGYYNAFLQGRGQVSESNKAIVINKLLMVALGGAALILGGGLLGLAISSFVSVLVSRVFVSRIFWRDNLFNRFELRKQTENKLLLSILMHNSLKLGWVYIGAFLITRANLLIASSYFGLDVAASYGLVLQLLTILVALSGTLFSVSLPRLNSYQIKGDREALISDLSKSLFFACIFYIVSSLLLVIFGEWCLKLIGSDLELLELPLLSFFLLVMFLEMNHSLCASYLTTLNKVDFVCSALGSGVAIMALSFLLCGLLGYGLWALILSQGVVQLLYNNWKWPWAVCKSLDISGRSLYLTGVSSFLQKNKVRGRSDSA